MIIFSCFYDSAYQHIPVTVLAVLYEFLKYNTCTYNKYSKTKEYSQMSQIVFTQIKRWSTTLNAKLRLNIGTWN